MRIKNILIGLVLVAGVLLASPKAQTVITSTSGINAVGQLISSFITFPAGTILIEESANNVAQRNGTNAQQFNVYNTFTDINNNTRLELVASNTNMVLQTHSLSGGSNANSLGLFISANNNTANRWGVQGGGTNPGDWMQGTTPVIVDSIAVPTFISGFGTSPAIAGKAYAFRVTEGTPVGTSGIVAFNRTFSNIPVCSCVDETTVTAGCAVTPTTTQVTVSQAFGTIVAADKLAVLCRGF